MRIDEIKVTPYKYHIGRTQNTPTNVVFTGSFKSKDGSEVVVELYINGTYGVLSFTRDDEIQVTHQGDQFRILFTVMEIIEKIVPMGLSTGMMTEFTYSAEASEPSRVKLYTNKVAPRISQILGSDWSGPEILHNADEVDFIWYSSDHKQ